MEGRWRKGKMCWAAEIWGLEAAEVMSLGQSKRRVKNKSLSLFWSSLQSQWGRGWGPGSRPRQGLLGNGKGCQAGPTANIRSSHLCSQKPGVLPKASFRLHGMITLDVGQLLRACSLSLPPSIPLSLSLYAPSLGSLSLFPLPSKAFCQTCSSCHGCREWNIKKVSNESGLDPDVPHVYPFRKKTRW